MSNEDAGSSFTSWRLSPGGWILCAQVSLTEAYRDTVLLPAYLLFGSIMGGGAPGKLPYLTKFWQKMDDLSFVLQFFYFGVFLMEFGSKPHLIPFFLSLITNMWGNPDTVAEALGNVRAHGGNSWGQHDNVKKQNNKTGSLGHCWGKGRRWSLWKQTLTWRRTMDRSLNSSCRRCFRKHGQPKA